MRLDVVFDTVVAEFVAIKLASVVHDEGMWDTKPHCDVFVDEHLNSPFCDRRESFGLSPLSKLVDGNDDVAALALSR